MCRAALFLCICLITVGVCGGLLFAQSTTGKNKQSYSGAQASRASEDEYVDILAFINQSRLQFYWDGSYKSGIITDGNTIISFQPGDPNVLINFSRMQKIDSLIYKNGELKATRRFLSFMQSLFFSGDNNTSRFSQPQPSSVAKPKPENDNQQADTAPFVDDTKPERAESSNAAHVPIGQPSLHAGKTQFNKIAVVVIDPGHGGKDPGTIGKFTYKKKSYRILEKTIVLSVAGKVKALLQKKFPNLKIIMTRTTDIFVALEKRIIIANDNLKKLKDDEAILFVSIHANGVWTPKASGFEVWYLPPGYRRNLIEKKDVKKNNQSIYSIINNIREEEITLENIQLAKNIITGMADEIGELSENRGIKEEEWYVIRNAKMPAVLVELGFVTNFREGIRLTTNTYQNTLSRGIVKGITNYMESFDVSQIR